MHEAFEALALKLAYAEALPLVLLWRFAVIELVVTLTGVMTAVCPESAADVVTLRSLLLFPASDVTVRTRSVPNEAEVSWNITASFSFSATMVGSIGAAAVIKPCSIISAAVAGTHPSL